MRLRFAVALAAGLVGMIATMASPAGAVLDGLPNMIPYSIEDLGVARPDGWDGTPDSWAIRLSLYAGNVGEGALDLLGIPTDETTADAYQCTLWVVRGACAERTQVGQFIYHPQHAHWHYDEYAQYELRSWTPETGVDWSDDGLVAGGDKISFCLMDSERIDDSNLVNRQQLYASCPGVIQGISPGWADIYGSYLFGQQIRLDGVADGEYAVVARVNPAGRLLETTLDDNVDYVPISLKDGGTRLEVL